LNGSSADCEATQSARAAGNEAGGDVARASGTIRTRHTDTTTDRLMGTSLSLGTVSLGSPLVAMQASKRTSSLTIHDPRAAAVFGQSQLRRILLQFAHGPRSIAEVARESGLDMRRLHRDVTRLHGLGLLVVVEERRRAGRAIRLYEALARRFYIPAAALPVSFSRGLALELREALDRDAATAIGGMEFWLDDDGRVSGRIVAQPGASFVPMDSWRILRLSASRAMQLQRELAEVLDRFQREAGATGSVHLVHTAVARRLEQAGATDNPVQLQAATRRAAAASKARE
jgi:hypothetical protein